MSRVTDANLLFSGTEPKFSSELSAIDMIKTLSWYSQNKDKKDAFKWSCDFFKKKFNLDASSILKNKTPTFGFVSRIVSNGGQLSTKDQIWFDNQVENVKKELQQTLPMQANQSTAGKPIVVSIQDRIREKANECIGELEGQIDELIQSSFKATVSPNSVFQSFNIKDVQTKYIIDWAKAKKTEFEEVTKTNDPVLKEGYSNFSKSQLKKLLAYFDQVILDCQKISGDSTKARKPRKRKAKSPEQLVAKMNYMADFKELKLTSVKPTDIIGALSLWVYNIKTRKMGVYHAEDAGGLSVKGSTIVNFAESKSVQKKLRKPEVTLPEVLKGGKVFLRNAMENIRAVESALTGRINSDTILLRVTK